MDKFRHLTYWYTLNYMHYVQKQTEKVGIWLHRIHVNVPRYDHMYLVIQSSTSFGKTK